MTLLRIGTRRSALAQTQARHVADALTARTGAEVELVGVTTHGDVSRESLAQIGGTGVFVNALRDRLLDGEIDIAVHSLKDLPTTQPDELTVAAIPSREEPRDAFVSRDGRKLADLPPGARVGTGSPRRAAQLRAARPDIEVSAIRGNVDTRLGKVTSGELDALVLAGAGLARLGRLDTVSEVLDPDQMLPAPGQGALAVECRAGSADMVELLGAIDDPETRACVTAERMVLAVLEAGCSAPVGAYADTDRAAGEHSPELHLRAAVVSVDGSASVRLSATGPPGDATGIGRNVATDMLAKGAATVMGERIR